MQSKICGVKDSETLNFLVNYKYPPQLIGFICNYPKSKRFVEVKTLQSLLRIDNKKTQFVSVLVKPDEFILNEMQKLNFEYYQIYDCTPDEIKSIKKKYNKKIISAITVETKKDILKYKKYEDCSDIILFDSKGYEKSLEFDHTLMENVPVNVNRMIAGNIKHNDNLDKFMKICNYIDISGGVETSGLKDISKVKIFLDNVKKLND
ncbi:phosphoribosylanthranilate isomerase [Candidatus Pelagibacter sp.]|nr:phosphoribosylanthranilate isomerase [Candidatus Pelagibacter sp.]